MTWTHSASIDVAATPAQVWRILSDVPHWGAWNAGIERIELHGPFAKGTTFTMQPPGSDPFTSTLLDVRRDELFTDETVIDGTRVVVEHRIAPIAAGSRVTYATTITGPMAEEFGPMVTGDFPAVLAGLNARAEA